MPRLNCKICAKQFYAKPRHIKIGWGKYCSDACKFKAQRKGKIVKCQNCGGKLYRTPHDFQKSGSGLFFCNRSCHAIWRNKNVRIGENHPNWITGINAYRNVLLRTRTIMKCKDCGNTDRRVFVVHHIDENRSNNKLSNLVRLCSNCHLIRH